MLDIVDLVKSFTGSSGERAKHVRAVDGISLTVEQGHLFTLLGPSGCGKTTTLRCVAGLEHPDRGEIEVAGRTLFSSTKGIRLSSHQRGLGMVFQSYAIWPHMDVFKNVAFPLIVLPRRQRPPKKQLAERVERALSVVQLDGLAGRRATDLSGGQQQRLALARALVMEPPLMLLDEPLSNLDAKLREVMRFELKRLQRELGITSVYVTHDQVEALAMSNLIAVMNRGSIQQIGTPKDIYERPQSRFVADFIGTSNFLEGRVLALDAPETFRVVTRAGQLLASSPAGFAVGDNVTVAVRPEHVTITVGAPTTASPGVWQGTVEAGAFLGESVDHIVRVGEIRLRCRSNPKAAVSATHDVTLTLPASACSLLPAE